MSVSASRPSTGWWTMPHAQPLHVGKRVIRDRLNLEAAFTELGEEVQENVIDRAARLA